MEHSESPSRMALAFYETLVAQLSCRTKSDRTCFRRVAEWLRDGVREGRLQPDIFEDVLLYAREASLPGSKNPNAVFMSLLRKELGYVPKA